MASDDEIGMAAAYYAQVYKHHAVSKVLREAARTEARAEAIASVSASARALTGASRLGEC